MKMELNLCDYYGMCDENGKSVGHTVKVTREYAELLRGLCKLKLYASPSVVKEIDTAIFSQAECLKYDICINGNSIGKRIIDKFKLMRNIRQILRQNGNFFFYQVDFFFFFYIYFFFKRNPKKKIYCLIFHQDFTGGKISKLLHKIYHLSLKKIDGVIYTQKSQKIEHKKTMWMPDFFYDSAIYQKYLNMDKKERCVCLGTMNQYKQLEELVEFFSHTKMPLLIAGRFDSKQRFKKLLQKKTDNIVIRDENLDYDEYLELLGSSEYSIIPYDMSQYINRTSGVLLESIYVGSIPVAPKQLLVQNELPGIGYQMLNEIKFEEKYKEIYDSQMANIRKNYSKLQFANQLKDWMCKEMDVVNE